MNTTPIYLIPENDPKIEYFKETFALFTPGDKRQFVLDILPVMVTDGITDYPRDFVLVLQHYPHLIPDLVFGINFRFRAIEDEEIYVPMLNWKEDTKYLDWFAKLGFGHLVIYFLADRDCRFYTLIGDLVANGTLKFIYKNNEPYLEVSGDALDEMTEWLFTASWLFYIYCHNTGFDPQLPIEALIAEFDLPMSFEDVKKQAEEDIEKGIIFKVIDNCIQSAYWKKK